MASPIRRKYVDRSSLQIASLCANVAEDSRVLKGSDYLEIEETKHAVSPRASDFHAALVAYSRRPKKDCMLETLPHTIQSARAGSGALLLVATNLGDRT